MTYYESLQRTAESLSTDRLAANLKVWEARHELACLKADEIIKLDDVLLDPDLYDLHNDIRQSAAIIRVASEELALRQPVEGQQ